MAIVKIDFNVDDTSKSIQAMIKRLAPGWPVLVDNALTLDLSECKYLGPAAVVILAALCNDLKTNGKPLIFVPPKLPELRAYCGFSGVLMATGTGPAPNPSHPKNVTIPTRNFTVYDATAIDLVVHLARRFMKMSSQTESVLRVSMTEIVYNVLDHAKSRLGGFLSARALTGERQVRFCIADFGEGIPKVIRRAHPDLVTDQRAVAGAFDDRRTSRSRSGNRGLGLHSLLEAVRHNGGTLELLSYGGGANSKGGKKLVPFDLASQFPGTMVIVSFNIDDSLYGEDDPAYGHEMEV
jgi:signal transduction histidine kinase